MKIEDYMSVVPNWANNNKRAAFMELVKNWVGENPDFKAVSDRNKANRGHEGTHKEGQAGLGEMEAWEHMKLVTPGSSEPRPAPAKYFVKDKENKEKYCEEFTKLHPEVEDPMSELIDEVAMMVAGGGHQHGRPAYLAGVSSLRGTSRRSRLSSPPEATAHLEEGYAAAYEEYLEKVQEHGLVKDNYFRWSSNQMAGMGESGNISSDGTPMHPGRCSPGASGAARHASSSPGGSRRGSTSPRTNLRLPGFTSSELRDNS
ncbi:hypothetical protein QYE76_071624 [Lolium multiflorum]|uniref:Uncharacterized protein n=1 Tax=Lolium multiflorum TaxID=4521 RepID=A0AAD8SL84_LOLMU|nr:hypothetical protein QYE76_071624 [Lolium multiflorum]